MSISTVEVRDIISTQLLLPPIATPRFDLVWFGISLSNSFFIGTRSHSAQFFWVSILSFPSSLIFLLNNKKGRVEMNPIKKGLVPFPSQPILKQKKGQKPFL